MGLSYQQRWEHRHASKSEKVFFSIEMDFTNEVNMTEQTIITIETRSLQT